MRGKRVGRFLYLSQTQLRADEWARARRAEWAARISPSKWNVVKFSVTGPRQTSLLRYEGLETLPLPQLAESWTTRPRRGLTDHRVYRKGKRPVFHKKETLGYARSNPSLTPGGVVVPRRPLPSWWPRSRTRGVVTRVLPDFAYADGSRGAVEVRWNDWDVPVLTAQSLLMAESLPLPERLSAREAKMAQLEDEIAFLAEARAPGHRAQIRRRQAQLRRLERKKNPAAARKKKKKGGRKSKYGPKPSKWTGEPGLNVLSLGLGRDSMTMLLLALEGKLVVDGTPLGIGDIDAVAFADPGHEWPHTYALIPKVEELARRHGFRFLVLRKPPAEGPHGWKRFQAERQPGARGLWKDRPWVAATPPDATIEEKASRGYYHMRAPVVEDYLRLCRITLPNKPACTINHKITPINRRLIDDLVAEKWGLGHFDYKTEMWEGKRKPNLAMIGIAADEKKRLRGADARAYEGIDIVESRFPLAEAGITKADEQPVLERWGFGDVRKSGCVGCHYQGADWFWALSKLNPEGFRQLVEYEAASVAKDKRDGRRPVYLGRDYPGTGLYGQSPLRERVRRWRKDNPRITADQVLDSDVKRCGPSGCAVELTKVVPAAALKKSSQTKPKGTLSWRRYPRGYKATKGKTTFTAVRGRSGWTLYATTSGKRRRLGRRPTFRQLKEIARL